MLEVMDGKGLLERSHGWLWVVPVAPLLAELGLGDDDDDGLVITKDGRLDEGTCDISPPGQAHERKFHGYASMDEENDATTPSFLHVPL